MDMKPDEIVVRYRQAKDKSAQLKILADLNCCTVDGIINVLCEHGGYKPQFFNTAKIKLKKQADTSETVKAEQPTIPEPPTVGADIIRPNETNSVNTALDILRAEIADINRQQYQLDMRKAELYQKISNALDVMRGW